MEPVMVISIITGLIVILLFAGVPLKPLRLFGLGAIKLLIGAMFLFFLNTAGNNYGIHVPINFFTTAVSGFMGLPGVAALVAVQLVVLG